jgi:hypothetical protein
MDTIQEQARAERQRRYAAETEQHERASMRELEELFDHRHDGLAANRRFQEHLAWHAGLFAGRSQVTALQPLIQAERRLQQARGRRPQ